MELFVLAQVSVVEGAVTKEIQRLMDLHVYVFLRVSRARLCVN
jgi:hypothetical protein